MLYFVTSNAGKFAEIKAIIPDVEQLQAEVDEIQSLDAETVIRHKLDQAAAQHNGEFIVEDTSLAIDCLGRLPGTLTKWFIEAIGVGGIADLVAKYPDAAATARTIIGYRDQSGGNHYFTGELRGQVVAPRGNQGFGWDPIFQPEGHNQTFAELGPDTKNTVSPRSDAAAQLKIFINQL